MPRLSASEHGDFSSIPWSLRKRSHQTTKKHKKKSGWHWQQLNNRSTSSNHLDASVKSIDSQKTVDTFTTVCEDFQPNHADDSSLSCCSASTTRRRNKSGKTVSFAETTSIVPTLTMSDLTLEEYEATWYTYDEFAEIKSSATILLRQAKVQGLVCYVAPYNTFPSHPLYCLRGLEAMTRQGGTRRRERRMSLRQTVALCQQNKLSLEDTASTYRQQSLASVVEAKARGEWDHWEANAKY